jgi:hypothetical protein
MKRITLTFLAITSFAFAEFKPDFFLLLGPAGGMHFLQQSEYTDLLDSVGFKVAKKGGFALDGDVTFFWAPNSYDFGLRWGGSVFGSMSWINTQNEDLFKYHTDGLQHTLGQLGGEFLIGLGSERICFFVPIGIGWSRISSELEYDLVPVNERKYSPKKVDALFRRVGAKLFLGEFDFFSWVLEADYDFASGTFINVDNKEYGIDLGGFSWKVGFSLNPLLWFNIIDSELSK